MHDFFTKNFAIILLSLFVVVFTGVTLFVFIKLGASKDAVSWATNAFSGFMGALLGLITGTTIGASRRLSDNGNGAQGQPGVPNASSGQQTPATGTVGGV